MAVRVEEKAEPPEEQAAPPVLHAPGRLRRSLAALGFLAPAIVSLGVWVIYPTIATIIRSFYNAAGNRFIGIDNYRTLFSTSVLVTAIKNNAIWVAVVPAVVTSLGLVLAVLTERVGWRVVFRTVVFMPMAISLFAAGVIWRIMDQQDPSVGAVNAGVKVVRSAFVTGGPLTQAQGSTALVTGSISSGFTLKTPLHPGSVAPLGLTAIPPSEIPKRATQAVLPAPASGEIVGVVWRDFSPRGGKPGRVDPGELAIPGATVILRNPRGTSVATTRTANNGDFSFKDVKAGTYHTEVGPQTFTVPYTGVAWLGSSLITPAIIVAYIWIWTGFAMVVVAAGLSSISREVLEAARIDGASEWQVFRRVTVPLLGPVLAVVFITMVIYVLKVFDIVLSIAPGSVQDSANVIALAMWRTAFSGVNNYGLGSAIATFLFILVIPVLALNVRRFRREV
jgi:alpha-glucoside transport system permease protein